MPTGLEVESAVKYVKHNGIAGKEFESKEALQTNLNDWASNSADWKPKRIVNCEEKVPIKPFEKEKLYLRAINKPPFHECKEKVLRVRQDGIIQVDNAYYQLPIRFAKIEVRVLIRQQTIEVYQGDKLLYIFNKKLDRKKTEFYNSYDEFGTTDPTLNSPIFFHRSMDSYDKTFAEDGDSPKQSSQNQTSVTNTNDDSNSFARDLSAYEKITGDF